MREIRFLDNIKIGPKLICGFIAVTLLMSSIGIIGFFGMTAISSQMNQMYSNDTVPLMQVASMEVSLNSMRALVFRSMAIVDEREQDEERMQKEIAVIDGQIQNISTHHMTTKESELLTIFTTQWKTYKKAALEVFELEKSGKDAEALISIKNGGDHANARRATVATFDQIKQSILNRAEKTAESGSAEVNRTVVIMTIIGCVIIIISLLFAGILTKRITQPLQQVMNQFDRMSRGEINTRLHLMRTDEIGQMAQMSDRFSDFLEKEVVNGIQQIAHGDLSAQFTMKSDHDQITPALSGLSRAVTAVMNELEQMADEAAEGDLTVRGDYSHLEGSYRDIIVGFNKTLELLITPINEAMNLAHEYAECNFSARFSEEFPIKGDFIPLRDAMNNIGCEVSQALRIVEEQMKDLKEHAKLADTGIGDVSRGASAIAAAADQTRANAEQSEKGISQVMTAMEDLTHSAAGVSTNVDAVASAGIDADQMARKGSVAASSAEEGMESIRQSFSEATRVMSEMRNQMGEINRITDIISGISEQTNLLALNAAIEAARAGDAGRGFSVVAGEVKALASQAGDAAHQIAEMITDLEKRNHRASTAMESAGDAIEHERRSLSENPEYLFRTHICGSRYKFQYGAGRPGNRRTGCLI